MAKDSVTPTETPTPPPPDPYVVLAKLTDALAVLAARQSAGPDPQAGDLMLKLTSAMERLSEANLQGSRLIAEETRRAHRPSNEVVPNISVFNRRGMLLGDEYQKPPLKCVMMIPWLLEWESLTREEVELANLLQPGEYQIKRNDDSKVRVSIEMLYKVDNVTPSRLVLTHETAFNNDNHQLIPPLHVMLRQLLKQHAPDVVKQAAAVMTDEEEEALILAGELTVSH